MKQRIPGLPLSESAQSKSYFLCSLLASFKARHGMTCQELSYQACEKYQQTFREKLFGQPKKPQSRNGNAFPT